jgi:hypothetical protein
MDESSMQPSFWRRHRWLKWCAGAVLLFLIALGVVISIALHRVEPLLRALIVERLQDHFHARVELDSFHVSLIKGVWAEGKGLRIWPPAQVVGFAVDSTAPSRPLIDVAEFRFHAPLHYKRGEPIHIYRVELRGMRIDVPPRTRFTHRDDSAATTSGPDPVSGPPGSGSVHFLIDSVVCTGAQLTLETSNPAKQPLVFAIRTIKVRNVSPGSAVSFEAELTNPKPAGLILTKGDLGPWVVEDPGLTPIKGDYKFEHADLGVFNGISGTLSSTGSYQGTMRDLNVQGHTDTPNFALTHFRTALPLSTDFRARVDGTNGDTWLDQVNAVLGSSHFNTSGKIVQLIETRDSNGKPAPPHSVGHQIVLDATVEHGQMADFLRLTSHTGDPMLTGTLHLKTSIEIPPGWNPVHERLRLKGNFLLDSAEFTSPNIQQRIDELSLRGQGKPDQVKQPKAEEDVSSSMTSDFTMDDGVLTLPNLVYTVPGAEIDMKGTYTVDGGGLSFRGTAKMQATVSQMVGGWKGMLLKPADRFFKKEGAGTKIGVHVDGTRESPHFGIDF